METAHDLGGFLCPGVGVADCEEGRHYCRSARAAGSGAATSYSNHFVGADDKRLRKGDALPTDVALTVMVSVDMDD
jgi:hypothetical protein